MAGDNVAKRRQTSNESGDKLWSIGELADYLGVPVGTIYQWRKRGKGPASFRVGRFVRFRRSEVESWLEARRGCGCCGSPRMVVEDEHGCSR